MESDGRGGVSGRSTGGSQRKSAVGKQRLTRGVMVVGLNIPSVMTNLKSIVVRV
jgi:hypothetical protein